ncbi:MAG: cupin domain-containing protein [Acidobacteria bacterium]|nr:cupin domain-containing protein [Acidobacteriota bacterium]MDA1234066.1 cupin domain-containing protein [Acidobacteriota bacterium]
MNNLRKSFLLAGVVLAAAGVMTMSAQVKDGVVGETSIRPAMHPFGDHRIFMQGPTEMMKSFESGNVYLKRGETPHPPHRHIDEEIMLITQGTGEIVVEGEVTKVNPGSMMYTGSNKEHGIVNTGDTELVFYYFKWIKKD